MLANCPSWAGEVAQTLPIAAAIVSNTGCATGVDWGACGAIGGLLLGSVLFLAAPVGLVAEVGPFVLTLLAALEAALAGAGASVVVAGLVGLGADDRQALRYEQALRADAFLVIVHGNADQIRRARGQLGGAGTPGTMNLPSAGTP
jgi:hypothetical protein